MIRTLISQFSLLLVIACPARAQNNPRFTHITMEQGLSQDIVTSIVQDKQGFMWFATEDGLNRYDGYSIKVYKHRPGDSTSIAANRLGFLFLDHAENLCVSSPLVLSRYDPGRDAFTNIPVEFNVFAVCSDVRGAMWVGTDAGIKKFNQHEGTFSAVTHSPRDESDLHEQKVLSLMNGSDGLLWVGTSKGLFQYDPTTETTMRMHFPGDSSAHVTSLLESREYLWFVVENQGLRRLHLKSQSIEEFRLRRKPGSLSDQRVLSLGQDRQGTIWVGTFSGLEQFDPHTNSFIRHQADKDDPHSLLGERVYSIFEDRAGALWVGTYRGGVNRLDPIGRQFTHFFHSPSDSRSLPSNAVLAICEDANGTLWIGTDKGGITRYDRNNNQFETYFSDKHWGATTAIVGDRNEHLWIATNSSGLKKFNFKNNSVVEFRHRPDDETSLKNNNIRSLFVDNEGMLWIGYELDQLTRYDDRTGTFVHFSSEGNARSGVWHISQARNGDLLLGAMYSKIGFYRFEIRTARFFPIEKTPGRSDFLQESVRAVYEDSSETLWLGTWGDGLYQHNTATNRTVRFTQLDGLANDYVKGLLADSRGHLWISTENGLSRFDPGTKSFKTFSAADGLQSNFFWSGSFCKGRDGRMYFGGTNGFSAFYPDSVKGNPNIPPVIITQFMVLNEPVKPSRSNTGQDESRLSYDQDFFSFEFVALNFVAPEKNQYAYMMEGFDKTWVQAGSRRYAAYTHLDPGTYTFRVKGSNNDGVWNEQGASLRIVISPPFWQTWWFRFLVLLLLTAALYGLYAYRVKRLLEIERLRGRIAADLHDDVGSELGHIALASQLLLRKVSLPEKEQLQLSSISTAALHASEMMKEVVWFLNPRNDSLDNIILKMRSLAEVQLSGLEVAFHAHQEAISVTMDPEVKRNIVLMYKEILYNIARHARATNVSVTIQIQSRRLHLTVKDNGIGFEPAAPSHGNGLNNLRNRAAQIGGELSIASGVGTGTTVSLVVAL